MIKKMSIKNFKKISFMDFEPTGNVVQVHGKNAQGKSSLLDAIASAFGGAKKLGDSPVKEGEVDAEIIIERDDMKIIRRVKKTEDGINTQLEVYDKTGNLVRRPQEFLDKALGNALLDPTEFVNMTPKERMETLQVALGLADKFNEIAIERGRCYNERRERGREEIIYQGQLKDYADLPERAVDEKQNQADIDFTMAEIKKIDELYDRQANETELRRKEEEDALEKRRIYERTRNERNGIEGRIEKLTMELERAHKEIKSKREDENIARDEMELAESKRVQGFTVPSGVAAKHRALKEDLKKYILNTKESERIAMRAKLLREQKDLLSKIDELTGKIRGLDENKKELLRATKFPIDGMAFGDEDIEINGIPFSSSSTAEKILMSVVINSEIKDGVKIMRIPDGSALDDGSMEKLKEIADKKDIQFFVETVDRSENSNVLIVEEGRLK